MRSLLLLSFLILFAGCREKKTGPETKTVVLVKGDVVTSSHENNTYLPVREGQVLSNREILTVAEEASCGVTVAGDTLFIGGGSRINISSKFEGDTLKLKVIAASGRVFLASRGRDILERNILFTSADAQATGDGAAVSIEKSDNGTRFTVLTGVVWVKAKKTLDSVSAGPGQTAVVASDSGVPHVARTGDEEFLRLKRWLGNDRVVRLYPAAVGQKMGAALPAGRPEGGRQSRNPARLKASAGHNIKALVDAKVKFEGKATAPAGVRIIRYEWDFDDDGAIDFTSEKTGEAEFVYDKAGIYNAVFQVFADDGSSAQSTLKAVITEPPRR
jgi:hypothetical protein